MQSHDQNQAAGNLKISREVIATIARYAALEIEGVDSLASFATNLKGWLLKKQSAKPIDIDLSDDVAVIELHVNIKAGVNIPETAEKIQSAVKEAVQNMTGIAVSRVNINIAGIVFAEPAEQTEA
ncbi:MULTISPECIES: Asp23/Gls24 family envelope stress response protein [Anaerotruncus]|nr:MULTISPECIES: Asp23/Gls24 family envelope stress response protein [Anaerotruncus]MBC3937451.1 Asp23/Gls24 family envelope stress response protein [Anaerotruncus massiliensis (ex Togo et al. 2019)]MCQ4894512.1 Asp23/Gls24 family envelope stress response protein [Anaerotruncus sp. DFI.9.16]